MKMKLLPPISDVLPGRKWVVMRAAGSPDAIPWVRVGKGDFLP